MKAFLPLGFTLFTATTLLAACSSESGPGAGTESGGAVAQTGGTSGGPGGSGAASQTGGTTSVTGGAPSSGGSPTGGTGGQPGGGTPGTGGTAGAASGGTSGTSGGGAGGSATGGAGGTGGTGAPSTGGGAGAGPDDIIVPVAASPNERHLLVRDEGNSQVHYIDLGAPDKTWHVDVPAGRELQLVGKNRFLIGTENGYEERSVVDGTVVTKQEMFPGTVAALRLRNGHTLLVGAAWQGEAGIVLLEVDDAGTELKRTSFPQYDYVRLVRPTPTGTYLLASNITIFEGDQTGNILWTVAVQDSTEAHAWKALRLPSGETVVATGYEASLQFFSAGQQFLRRVKAPALVTPSFFCDFQILSSGHYLVTNWQGHGMGNGNLGHQIVELDDQGTLVWSWQQDASYISSIQATILLDGLNLGKLHVEDTTGELVPVD